MKLQAQAARMLAGEEAATSIEYALIAMVIGIAIVSVLTGTGSNVGTMWNSVSTDIINAGDSGG